jgi:predicted PurR-regulated permease PerM
MAFLLFALLAVAYVGAVVAFVDIARRDYDPWVRIAWVAIILAFPIIGLVAYAIVQGNGHLLALWRRSAIIILIVSSALCFLWYVRDLLVPFVIAFFLAALLDPVVTRAQQHGRSRAWSVGSIYLLVFALIVLALLWVVPRALSQMQQFAGNVQTYSQSLTGYADNWYAKHKWLRTLGMHSPPSKFINDKSGPVSAVTKQALDTLKGTILAFTGRVLWLIIIPLSLFYFLLEYQTLRARLLFFVPVRHRSGVDRMSQEVVEIFSDYIRSLAIVCACYGVTAAVLFYLLGLKFALFLGLAAGVLYAVPYVGPVIGISTAGIIALTMGPMAVLGTLMTLPPAGYAVLVVVCYVAMHVTYDYGITPRVVGGSVGLHPLVNIFALMCGATLFGIWGMLLAVPVAASIQMLLVYFFPKLAEKPVLPTADAPTPDEVRPQQEEAIV